MSYESPIALVQTQSEMIQCIAEEQDKMVYAKVRQYVDVNKEELIKALQFDRDQYNKGYEDGLKDAVQVVYADVTEQGGSEWWACENCNCWSNNMLLVEYKRPNFCQNCGAKFRWKDGEQE